jgi:hypothetical protein
LQPGVVTPPDQINNPPVDILYDEVSSSTDDLLSGVQILTGKRHPVNDVPYKTEGKWDPGLTRIGDRWYLSYVIALDLFTDFQPALARSASSTDHTALEFVGADWGKRATEGPVIQRVACARLLRRRRAPRTPRQVSDVHPRDGIRRLSRCPTPDQHSPSHGGASTTQHRKHQVHHDHLQRHSVLRVLARLRHARRLLRNGGNSGHAGLRVHAEVDPGRNEDCERTRVGDRVRRRSPARLYSGDANIEGEFAPP